MERFSLLIKILDFMSTQYETITHIIVKDEIVEFKSNGKTMYLTPTTDSTKGVIYLEETCVIVHKVEI